MTLWQGVQFVVGLAAIVTGLLGAFYWYKASNDTSNVLVTDASNRHQPGVELRYEHPAVPGTHIYTIATTMEQSRLNTVAAKYTALALLLQAVSQVISFCLGGAVAP